jgi:cytochrome oxidase Cu insertion factor (SCO1/SenC/PrrC family)/thiol-disulfide isomerase/thioredoxin
MALSAAGIVAVTLVVLEILSGHGNNRSATTASVPAPIAIGTELARPKPLPSFDLVDSRGKPFSLARPHGKWIVLAPSMTLCREVCPMTTGVLSELVADLKKDGVAQHVTVASATVDPWRDTPARLRAYKRRYGADFTMLTGSPAAIHRLWRFFGVQYQRVPEGKPATIDWWTHRPETFDIDHTDGFFVIDPAGQERLVDVGMPTLNGRLPRSLRSLLDSNGLHNLRHPQLPWTAQEVAEDVLSMMNRPLPKSAQPAPVSPSAATARNELRGSPKALAALHAQAGKLIGDSAALSKRLNSLHGYPVVLNAWASWCTACQQEFPLLATAAAAYGHKVAFVGADVNDDAGNARSFLRSHPISYPSYPTSATALSPLANVGYMPTTIFLSASGKVAGVHIGEYQTLASLEQDIQHYDLGVTGSGMTSG